MATTNVSVSESWTLAVSSAVSDALLSVASGGTVEVATTGADGTAPTVLGHHLELGMGITRDIPGFGSGAIWARAIPSLVGASASAVLAVNA
jgi:hypothetical protein